jgi:PAS domain S-box-containing protein/putative nucleotidyltransferase with HDIG domain
MKILVAEDDEAGRRLLQKQLRVAGHDVETASDGREALQLARKNPPEVLVSDILMPEMDGFQLCMEWKQDSRLKDIPLVFHTATYTSDEDVAFALSLGADAFVQKPIEPEKLEQVLAAVVEKSASGSSRTSEFTSDGRSSFLASYSKRLLAKLVTKVAQLEEDIARREKIEEQLNLEAQLLDAASDIIYVTDLDWTILYVNEASCLSLGYCKNELVGRDLRDYIAPEYVASLEAAGPEDESPAEIAHIRRDGTAVPVEVHPRIIIWGGRNVRLALVHDITERKKADARMRETNEQLERALEGTLGVVEQMVEARDPYTSGHQRRVTELAVAIARKLELPENTCVSVIRTAALIHDIGKTAVPAEILSKPGKLTTAEFELIKAHPQTGYDIIRRANLPEYAADVVLQHHERLDGSGYPQGLRGDDMLPEAQILAVADVVEAMSSHRPYRPALGIDAALDEISKGNGTLYYPEVVNACLAIFREDGFTFSS